jgi:endonuclease YncB( thermonuclease family)
MTEPSRNLFKFNFYTALLLLGITICYSSFALSDSLNCPCKVIKVTDGDTVHVLNQVREMHKIRLGGIDAPEKKQAFGKKSTKNLAKYIAGQNIEVEYDKRDRYGRIIGKLLKDGKDINLQQVKDGYAWHYKHYLKEQSKLDQVLYGSAEMEARKKRIGLWSVPAVAPWDFRRAKRNKSN